MQTPTAAGVKTFRGATPPDPAAESQRLSVGGGLAAVMQRRRSRRRVLAAAGSAVAAGLAGCVGGGSDESTTESSKATTTAGESTTDAPDPEPGALTLNASVQRQADADAPARVEVAFGYEGPGEIDVKYGPALFVGPSRRVDDVVLDAVDAGATLDAERSDGCWRVPDEYGTFVDGDTKRSLTAGDEHTERYDVYTAAGAGGCRPAGTYALSTEVAVRLAANVTATLMFGIDGDGAVAVEDATGITVN